MRWVSHVQASSSTLARCSSLEELATKLSIERRRLRFQMTSEPLPWLTPMSAKLSGNRPLRRMLYSAGTTSREVRSPLAPKITMAHGLACGGRPASPAREVVASLGSVDVRLAIGKSPCSELGELMVAASRPSRDFAVTLAERAML